MYGQRKCFKFITNMSRDFIAMLQFSWNGCATQNIMSQHCDIVKIPRTINLLVFILQFAFLWVNIFVTFVENYLLITPIYFVHTNSHTLRRCQMTVMPSLITDQSSVCSTVSSDKPYRNIKGPCYRPFVKGIHR